MFDNKGYFDKSPESLRHVQVAERKSQNLSSCIYSFAVCFVVIFQLGCKSYLSNVPKIKLELLMQKVPKGGFYILIEECT